MKLNTPQQAISAIKSGQMVIIVDDENRENEGDLVMAASLVKDDAIAFMIRHTSGIICTPITNEQADRLSLTPMVQHNNAPLETAFTVTIDYREGLTTGISAKERCATIHALTKENITPQDFVRPGHIFPLIARDGGVLIRSGHTEAAVDLANLAELPPVGVIAELVNDDGSVKKGKELFDFAVQYGLVIISIEDLIAYRQKRESLISRIAELEVETIIGKAKAIIFRSQFEQHEHCALIFGDVAQDMPVRLQREDVFGDVFLADNNIARALKIISQNGSGAIIYLRTYHILDYDEPAREKPHSNQWREIGLGAQILRDIGLESISLLTSQERQYVGIHGFGIEVSKTILL